MTFFVELGTALATSLIADGMKSAATASKGFFADASERIRNGSLGIFIFGPQGAGKSTLRATLSGERTIFQPTPPYKSSPLVETSKLSDNRFYFVKAGPGQINLAADQWPNMYGRISETKQALCIFCASFGLESPWFDPKMSSVAPSTLDIKQYANERRALEMQSLELLCKSLSAYNGAIKFLTVVTKQDLWWKEKEAVSDFYQSAEFTEPLRELEKAKMKHGFAIESCAISLSIENLTSGFSSVALAETSEGYDQKLQAVNFQNFLSKISSLTGR